MDASIYVAPPMIRLPDVPATSATTSELTDLLRQVLEVQREQLTVLRNQVAAQDNLARWRAFLARWQTDFPDVGLACKEVLPAVERAYLSLMQELTERLQDEHADPIDNDFALSEFLDRYGMRLNQLGTILSQLGPLADASTPASDQPNA